MGATVVTNSNEMIRGLVRVTRSAARPATRGGVTSFAPSLAPSLTPWLSAIAPAAPAARAVPTGGLHHEHRQRRAARERRQRERGDPDQRPGRLVERLKDEQGVRQLDQRGGDHDLQHDDTEGGPAGAYRRRSLPAA